MNVTKEISANVLTCAKTGSSCTDMAGLSGKRTKLLIWLAIAAGAVAVTAGLTLKWGWLVAVGAAPLVMALIPCVAMCGLGVVAILGLAKPK